MTMNSGGFFAHVWPAYVDENGRSIEGLATLYFYDWRKGEKQYQMTIPLRNNIQIMTLYSRLEGECPAFFSRVDTNFRFPHWNKMKMERPVRKRMTSEKKAMQMGVSNIYMHIVVVLMVIATTFMAALLLLPYFIRSQTDETEYMERQVLDLGWREEDDEKKKMDKSSSIKMKSVRRKGKTSTELLKLLGGSSKTDLKNKNPAGSLDKTQSGRQLSEKLRTGQR